MGIHLAKTINAQGRADNEIQKWTEDEEITLSSIFAPTSFLTPRRTLIKDLAYYGEFLVLTGFDDGWKSVIYPQMIQKLNQLVEQNSNSTVHTLWKETEDAVHITLQNPSSKEQDIEAAISLWKKLQEEYICSPVIQSLWWNIQETTWTSPVEIFSEDENSQTGIRRKIQNFVCRLEEVNHTIEETRHIIEQLQKFGMSELLESNLQLTDSLREQKKHLQQELSQHAKYYYYLLASQENTTNVTHHLQPTPEWASASRQDERNHSPSVKTTEDDSPQIQENTVLFKELLTAIQNLPKDIALLQNSSTSSPEQLEAILVEQREQEENKARQEKYDQEKIQREIQAEEEKKLEQEKEKKYINKQILTASQEAQLQIFVWSFVDRIKNALEKNIHQSPHILQDIIAKEWRVKRILEIGSAECEWYFQSEVYKNKDGKYDAKLEVKICTNIPHDRGGDTMQNFDCSSESVLTWELTTALTNIFKRVLRYDSELKDFVWKDYSNMQQNFWFSLGKWRSSIRSGYEKDSHKSDLENTLLQRKRFFQRYDLLLELSSNISKELKDVLQYNLFDHITSDNYEFQEIIDFLKSCSYLSEEEAKFQAENINNWFEIDTHSIPLSLCYWERQELMSSIILVKNIKDNGHNYKTRFQRWEIYRTNGSTYENVSWVPLPITNKKWTLLYKDYYRMSRILYREPHFIQKCLETMYENYQVQIVSVGRTERTIFKLTPLADDTLSDESYLVSIMQEIRHHKKDKCFYPHVTPVVIPFSHNWENIVSDIKQVQWDIYNAFKNYWNY